MIKFYRIGWLDSCRMPSRVHCTADGVNTYCNHDTSGGKWIIQKVPTRTRGQSRYCRVCFKDQPKNLDWWMGDDDEFNK